MTSDELKRRYVDYFRESGKDERRFRLGTEFEHFIVDRETLKSYGYFGADGIGEILRRLIALGWDVWVREGDNPLALKKERNAITLEPGGQLELSLRPLGGIRQVADEYVKVLAEVASVLAGNQAIVSLGYHPASRIEDIPLLPKKRYDIMFDYLGRRGAFAHHMMKGTAATQVSIDYRDEEDFVKKFRTANFLSPFLARMFDAAPVFQGEIYGERNLRVKIWSDTDAARCGVVPGALDRRFGFEDYADYLLNVPPMFVHVGDEYWETGDQPLRDVADQFDFDQELMEFVMTLCFPDVRAKNFIEIRMADALPFPLSMAVPAVVKGIFYDHGNLEKYYRLSMEFANRDVAEMKRKLIGNDDVEHRGVNVHNMCQTILADALRGVSSEERKYVLGIRDYLTTPRSSFAESTRFPWRMNRACFLNHCAFNPDGLADKCLLAAKVCA